MGVPKGTPRPAHYGQRRPRPQPNGYVKVYDPGHPLAMKDGYVYEHRKVVHDAGIEVPPKHEIHHRNMDHADNRLSNLQVVTTAAHRRLHGYVGNQYGRWEVAVDTKVCTECGERKPLDAYTTKPDGRPYACCKPCAVIRQRRYKQAR